jgi:D-beta-D-heptose 7-phosphate kinase/D-beta-D-heptose 1-phosphate adenosyltransferase
VSDGSPAGSLSAVLDRFPGARLLVVGDVMLDHFLFGRVQRISPEAPVPIVEFDHEEHRLGGAANVANNLRASGAAVTLVGLVGIDDTADRMRAELRALGLEDSGLVATAARPTTRKMRVVTMRTQQVARVDFEADDDVDGALEAMLVDRVLDALDAADGVVVSDYLKGVVTAALMRQVVDAAGRRHVPVLVDPKIPHIDYYRGATLITPNHQEAEIATARRIRSDREASDAARAFRTRAGCASVLITRGEHGMWLLEGDPDPAAGDPLAGIRREVALPAAAREVADVTGAGDTVVATMALALAAGATLVEAAILANHAAGVSVSRFGPAAVSVDDLRAALRLDSTATSLR